MKNANAIKNVILVTLLIIGALCLVFEGVRVYGIIALFCAILYLLWDKNDDDFDNGIYNLKY